MILTKKNTFMFRCKECRHRWFEDEYNPNKTIESLYYSGEACPECANVQPSLIEWIPVQIVEYLSNRGIETIAELKK